MEEGKISIQFPEYHFAAELIDDKLVMVRESIISAVQSHVYSLEQILKILSVTRQKVVV